MRRLLLAPLLAAATLLALEGALSLARRPSLVHSLPRLWGAAAPDEAWRPLSDEERRRAAAENPGIWRAHPDPRVGYVLRTRSELAVRDGQIRSDGLGLRRRPGEPREGALRIAVMGASIPFGYGLDDDEVLAHRLELALDAARGPDARPVLCRTVAMGRWNVRNAVSFLLDHLPELRPDLVLFMPFENDLSDTDQVDETGHRRAAPDPASSDPWLSIRSDDLLALTHRLQDAHKLGLVATTFGEIGPDALTSDIAPESTRRYDENAALLLHLRDELSARGTRFVYLVYDEEPHTWHLLRRLLAAAPDLQVIPLLRNVLPEFTLGYDPHPSARTIDVLAGWVAQDLLRLGLLDPGAGRPLPETPPEYAALRAQARGREEVEALSRAARDEALRILQPVIDFRDGRGLRQILGGVSPQATSGPRLLALLARRATLVVELAPLADRPDLYPLRVQVLADGAPLGELLLASDGPASARFPLPPGGPCVEVKLAAEDWVVSVFGDWEVTEAAAYRPQRLACEDA
jgi:hypothetical protein